MRGSTNSAGFADSLYSPVKSISADSYSIIADDLGKTLMRGEQPDVATHTLSIDLTQAVSSTLPVGSEIALAWLHGAGLKLTGTGVKLLVLGEDAAAASVQLTDKNSMAAIKKMSSDNAAGDTWLVTGLVEVTA